MEDTADRSSGIEEDVTPSSSNAVATLGRRRLLRHSWVGAAAPLVTLGGAAIATGCEEHPPEGKPVPKSPEGALGASTVSDDPGRHLVARLTYGVTATDLATVERDGRSAWLEAQLDPSGMDTSDLDAKLGQLPALAMSTSELQTAHSTGSGAPVAAQLKLAWFIRAVHSPAQLFERTVEFFSDHLNVPTANRRLSLLKIVDDREVVRRHALGRFDDLLVASAQSPAMLLYLDNATSSVRGINENYSRELLELHTVGRDGGYDEADVVSLARLLTGWTIDRSTGEFRFVARDHDAGALSVMGWQRPSAGDPFDHGVEFLRWLAMQPATATHVCTKLARRFVADEPSPDMVDAMAAAWSANDSSIAPVIRSMVDHGAFERSVGAKFQRPLDHVAAALRALDADVRPSTDLGQLAELHDALATLGQVPFEWPAPNGYPDVEGAWLNAGALLNRWNLVGDLAAGASEVIRVDLGAIAAGLRGMTSDEAVAALAQRLLNRAPSEMDRRALATATGWRPGSSPTPDQIDDGITAAVVTLLTSADAQYR